MSTFFTKSGSPDFATGCLVADRLSARKDSSKECSAAFFDRVDILFFLPLTLLWPIKAIIAPLAAKIRKKYMYPIVFALLLARIRSSYGDESEPDIQLKSRHPA